MREIFRKYNIWQFIIVAVLSTIILSYPYRVYYYNIHYSGLNNDNLIEVYRMQEATNFAYFFGGIALLMYFSYLKKEEHPAFYNKSYALRMMFFVPYILSAFLMSSNLYISKPIVVGIYILYLGILFYFYIKNYNNTEPKDPTDYYDYFENPLAVEMIYIFVVYTLYAIGFSGRLILALGISVVLILIQFIVVRKIKKKTYLEDLGKRKWLSILVILYTAVFLSMENSLLTASLVYWSAVAIYFLFIRKGLIEKANN